MNTPKIIFQLCFALTPLLLAQSLSAHAMGRARVSQPLPQVQLIPVTNESLYITPENWTFLNVTPESQHETVQEITVPATPEAQAALALKFKNQTVLATNYPGAYVKIGFTGTSFGLVLDTSATTATNDELPKIGYRVDGGKMQYVIAPYASDSLVIPLLINLTDGSHEIRISLDGLGKVDRWVTPVNQLKIKGFLLDPQAKTFYPQLQPKKMIVYGDSITEGAALLARPNYVYNKQWSSSWDALLADELGAETSTIAYAAQGFHNEAQGNVPSFLDASNQIQDQIPRKFSHPDYVFVLQGTNGGAETEEVMAMMHRLRANYPEAQIFFVVPFGGFAEDAITEAYQEIAPNDANLYLIDLGQTAKDIVSANSVDNIHPEKEGHRLLAELLYQVFLETEATRPPELVKTQPTARPAPTPILSGFASWLDGAR